MKKLFSIILAILMIVTTVPFAFAADDYAVVDTEAGTVTIDGTLGGKTTATEDDIITLLDAIKGYVESGITTIIVTGSEPALIYIDYIDSYMPAVSEALYRLTNEDSRSPYCGTIDLILPDVTEILDDEFNNTFALNSITLPKVTKLGDLAFYACCFIQTIAFGSVVTDVEEGGGVMFAAVGEEVGGCDLILNCGQMNSSYIPDLDTNTWKFRYENEFKSITLTHNGGEATCIAKAVCETCGEEYGEFDANKHTLVQKDAKAPTCTEIGWDAYESCTECDYTTYEVLLADPDAHNFEDGKCECGYVCTHETYSEGVCVDCGEVIYTYDEATDTYTVYTFAALKAALTAGGNIILGADITRENTKDITAVPENITAVLDLNGKTITSAPAVPGVNYEIICVNGNLTIKDSDTNGTITANSVISCIYVEGGNLTIEAGNFICDPDLSYAVDVYSGNAVINGGTFNSFNVVEGKAVINGGTFTNFNVFDEGKAVINGGEFQSCIWTSGSLIINGGTFYSKEYTFNTYGGTFDIYGGEFHEDPSEYVANGYEAVANENGTWTVVCAHTDKLVQVDAKAPTCTEIGWDAYEYCSACNYTTYVELPASHNIVTVDAKAPTCTEIGWDAYEYCTACNYTTYVEIPENGHTPLDAVRENEVAPKCDVTGSYDLVVYCACGEELDRETKTVDALKHSFTKYEVTEEAKCGVEGKEVAYCDNGCGETDEKAIDALTHTDADGDYICDHGCGYEYEKPAPEEPTPDTPDEPNTPDEPDTPDEPTDSTCDHLCHKSGILGFFWKIVKFFSKLFKINPVCECGAAHY